MKYCSKCGREIMDEAVICPNCGCAVASNKAGKPVEADEVSVGLCILAVFIPLFGLIYWALKHSETPRRAKAVGIAALVSWIVEIVLGIVVSIALPGMLFSVLGSL